MASLLLLPLMAGALVLSSCKSSSSAPEFGVPEDHEGKWFSSGRRDQRSANWSKKRANWAKREQEKFDQMFDRMKGEPYH